MKVLVLPQDDNPYQKLLYAFHIKDLSILYLKRSKWNFLDYSIKLIRFKLGGGRLVHLHWLYLFTIPLPFAPVRRLVTGLNINFFLTLCKLLHLRLVETVHNTLPHEKQTNDDGRIARRISTVAKAKIVHTKYTVKQMKKLGLDTSRLSVIPHGNYIGVYPAKISRANARKRLNISEGAFVVLFFGLIRPYKGIEDLLSAFLKISNPNIRLIIAGKCSDVSLKKQIGQACRDKRIFFNEGYVEDSAVATYFKACDVVCLPFRAITTSGSALLALSFGKPLIAPLSGAITDLPEDIGFLYKPSKKHGLENSLKQAIRSRSSLRVMNQAAIAYAETLSWEKITKSTYEVYKDALEAN